MATSIALLPRFPLAEAAFMGGFIVASYGWMVALLMWDLTASGRLSNGALAEESTSKLLRRVARRRGRVIDDIQFLECNVDHALVTEDRVLVVESKWTSVKWTPDDVLFLQAIEQARYSARKIRLLLLSRGLRVRVEPAVAVWGPGVKESLAVEQVGEVVVLVPSPTSVWAKRLLTDATQPMGASVVKTTRVLGQFVKEREIFEQRSGATMKRLLARTR